MSAESMGSFGFLTLLSERLELGDGDGDDSGCMPPTARVMNGGSSITLYFVHTYTTMIDHLCCKLKDILLLMK
jgi:hypothetical protein